MDKRIIAVEWLNDSTEENVLNLLSSFSGHSDLYSTVLFKDASKSFKEGQSAVPCTVIDFPESIDNDAKKKNFIFDFAIEKKFDGFLHIIEDNVALDKDPQDYIEKIEQTMSVLDYSIHFSTATDPCNYIFKKFNPRLTLDVDDEAIKAKLHLPDKISFTSHSNTCWTIYDMHALGADVPRFNEGFSIAMFIIIEYLARRRATRKDGQLYFMNQYLSISDEIGTFHAIDTDGSSIDPKKMQEEDALFKSMKIDYAPDNNLDSVLDMFYQKIKEKMA